MKRSMLFVLGIVVAGGVVGANAAVPAKVTPEAAKQKGCLSCHEGIEEILALVLAEQGETFDPTAVAAEIKKPSSGLTNLQRIRRIEAAIESIRPQLQMDQGDVELVDVTEGAVYVNMTGACSGCQMAAMTLNGIQQRIMEELDQFIKVLPASEQQKQAAMGG